MEGSEDDEELPARISKLDRTVYLEGAAQLGLFAALVTFCISIEAFPRVAAFASRHEHWELDEILVAMIAVPIGLTVFSWRRLAETRRETCRRIAAERRARAMALHDSLTGLPNRRGAGRMFEEALAKADQAPFALAMIDLKRFKSVNELHGHDAGDGVLLAVARRLRSLAEPDDVVVRLGGGAFMMLLRDTAPGTALVGRIHAISSAFASPLKANRLQKGLTIGVSIGATSIDEAGLTADQAMAQSAVAMRRAKTEPGNSFCFFEAGMDSAARRRGQLEHDLREALAAGRIFPYFQPLVEQASGRIVGYEALARWEAADGGMFAPQEFVAIAEETGQIDELYYTILEQAARAAATWPPDQFVSVNLSPRQLSNPWLVENTLRILAQCGLPTGRLQVEITETAFATDLEGARRVVTEFKRQRIRVALDDFGTGYSSFRLLKELEFDKLKIDQSFIRDFACWPNEAIVHAIASMAHLLDMEVTIEGIDSSEVAAQTLSLGCQIGQGYFYGRPLPVAAAGDSPPCRDLAAAASADAPTRVATLPSTALNRQSTPASRRA